jgi:hypothetical protein
VTQATIGNSTGIKFPSTSSFSRFHAACGGHFASDGRRRIPAPTRVAFRRSAVPASRARFFPAPHSSRAHSGPSAAVPDRFKNVLLSIDLVILPRLPATPLPLSATSYGNGFFSPGYRRLPSAFRLRLSRYLESHPLCVETIRSTGVAASRRPVGAKPSSMTPCAFGKYCSNATSAIGTIPGLAAVLPLWQKFSEGVPRRDGGPE